MTPKETKLAFIDALFNRGIWTKAVMGQTEYRTRCPFCGDSTSNPNIGKLYIKADPENNYSMIYHCFRCERSGVITSETLDALGIDNEEIKEGVDALNSNSPKLDDIKKQDRSEYRHFDFKLPKSYDDLKVKYIEDRLGISVNMDMLKEMKVVTSLKSFLWYNNINTYTLEDYMCDELERNFIGFLSYGGAYILFRKIRGNFRGTWIKYPVCEESINCKVFYSLENTIDLSNFDSHININMCEGIMDILSLRYVLGDNQENAINVAVTGKYYDPIIRYLISLGFIGKRVTLNIYSDNDEMYGNYNYHTTLNGYRDILKPVIGAFGETYVYYNNIGKDIGERRERISLSRYKIG